MTVELCGGGVVLTTRTAGEKDSQSAWSRVYGFERVGFDVDAVIVGTMAEFAERLDGSFDVVLAGHDGSRWTGMDVLELLRGYATRA
jgi:hypothetical protein